MSFPFTLPVGMISIYGIGSDGITPSGIVLQPNQRYGSVYNVWDGGRTFVYGGDPVIWKEEDTYCRLVIGSAQYTILPARLVTKDTLVL